MYKGSLMTQDLLAFCVIIINDRGCSRCEDDATVR